MHLCNPRIAVKLRQRPAKIRRMFEESNPKKRSFYFYFSAIFVESKRDNESLQDGQNVRNSAIILQNITYSVDDRVDIDSKNAAEEFSR